VPFARGWTYPKDVGQPQGRVQTLAGDGVRGFRDGDGPVARFNDPQGLAVDIDRNVYVADAGNHCIRRILRNGTATTFAGLCTVEGYRDGGVGDARFATPTGIALYHNASDFNRLTVYVSDTGNQRIRRIRRFPTNTSDWVVDTWAGGRTTQADPSVGPRGLQDGFRTEAGFNQPRGITVDDANNIFVADSWNHVIRWVDPIGNVRVIAGSVRLKNASTAVGREPPDPGCPYPCLEGVQGYNDGPRNESQFSFPQDVSISLNGTVRGVYATVAAHCVVAMVTLLSGDDRKTTRCGASSGARRGHEPGPTHHAL
jgi:hypothetical protein